MFCCVQAVSGASEGKQSQNRKYQNGKDQKQGRDSNSYKKKNVFVSFRILLSEITGRKEEGNLVKLCIIRSPAESKCA